MKYTDEQQQIINCYTDQKCNAFAGTGKSTTALGYAEQRQGQKILYLCFNKSVKEEASFKFAQKGIDRVWVETAHSLAYKRLGIGRYYKVSKSFSIFDILSYLKLKNDTDNFLYASVIKKIYLSYLNSNLDDIRKINLSNYVNYFSENNLKIEKVLPDLKKIWDLMESGKIDIIHDFYLKLYQLSYPILDFDYIIVDESQDLNPSMLEIVKQQSAIKLLLGDSYQGIYGWRGAVNAMESVDFETNYLTTSYRFDENIASKANSVLSVYNLFDNRLIKKINGVGGKIKNYNQTAIIARTNMTLLRDIIDRFNFNNDFSFSYQADLEKVYKSEDGISIFDLVNLKKGLSVKNEVLKKMGNWQDLKILMKKMPLLNLASMISLVDMYSGSILYYLKRIKSESIKNSDKAEFIYTTAHKSKGLEYDNVILKSDFITNSDIAMSLYLGKKSDLNSIKEEINMFYVALTRTRKFLEIDSNLILNSEFVEFILNKLKAKQITEIEKKDFDLLNIEIEL